MVRKTEILRYLIKVCFFSSFILFIVYNLWPRMYSVKHVFRKDPNIKYILQWTDPSAYPFWSMGERQDNVLKNGCPVNNCFVTSDKALMNSVTDFDAILFHGPDLVNISLPDRRLSYQKYVFVSMESAAYYTIMNKTYDNFFNLTWTYKLNSDLFFGYIVCVNKNGYIIGPKEIMHWIKFEDMKPINGTLKKELSYKKKLAAWFVSNCKSKSKREKFVKRMRRELLIYNESFSIDIFGTCSKFKCNRNMENRCMFLIKKYYYFYLSFENSFSEDYVTEKLLTALQNNAVPVVLGGANYTRFMPDSAYLNARKFSARTLVQEMVNIANNITKYHDFFRWKNYYTYSGLIHTGEATRDYPKKNYLCRFCEKMNEQTPHKRKLGYYTTFRKWWNPSLRNIYVQY